MCLPAGNCFKRFMGEADACGVIRPLADPVKAELGRCPADDAVHAAPSFLKMPSFLPARSKASSLIATFAFASR